MSIKIIEGDYQLASARFGLAVEHFNSFIVDRLLERALDTLQKHGVMERDITVVKVPGAYELPLAVKMMLDQNTYDGIIALGAVICGGTPHFEYVAGECVKGLSQAGLDASLPVRLGVLTVDTIEQAIERAGTKAGNKGAEAAMTAIEMVSLSRQLKA